jgi:HD-GYP domain-containing protein (c-di-GMP phosphodiesterase class II)
MILLSIEHVTEKMQVAKNIYSAEGNVLLAEGALLNRYYIDKLKQLGISSLYIIDSRVGQIEVEPLVKIETQKEITKIAKETMTSIRKGQLLNGQRVEAVIEHVIEDLIHNRTISYNMVEIRAMNDYHFSHNVAVCVLSIMTGIAMGYGDSKLKQLGAGAILHDIGKARIAESILNKNGPLTHEEYLEIQRHPQIGYEVLQNHNDIDDTAKCIPWQHHERFDGSGYPKGLKGNTIHEYARIVTLADVYDAMSTDRIYRKRFLPHEVIEYIRDKGKILFDPELTRIFLQNIAPFPIGSLVLLNTSEKGVVVKVPKDFPTRPQVDIIFGPDGELLTKPIKKDLREDLTLFIVRAFKDNMDEKLH